MKSGVKNRAKKSTTDLLYTEEELQYLAKPFPGTLWDFSELLVQFVYVALFSGAFPLSYLVAYVDCIFQIRGDGMKLCDEHYRPDYISASDIGTWEVVLQGLVWLSVMVNSGIIAVSSDSLQPWVLPKQMEYGPNSKEEWAFRLMVGMAIEHIMFFALAMIQESIDDAPMWVLEENRRKAWKRDLAVRAEMSEHMQNEIMDNGKTLIQEYSHRLNHPQMEWHVDVRTFQI